MFNIVLVEPRIAGNVGTIGRYCYNLGFTLHIVGPHFLDYDDKKIMRAGLDYWDKLDVVLYDDTDDFLAKNKSFDRFFYASTKAKKYFCDDDLKYQVGDYFIFGSESFGLPQSQFIDLMKQYSQNVIKVPQKKHGRSLNLALSVSAISAYALSQNIFSFEE